MRRTFERFLVVPALVVVLVGASSCSSDSSNPANTEPETSLPESVAPSDSQRPAETPPPSSTVPATSDDPEAVFEGVVGYRFTDAAPATVRALEKLFRKNARKPVDDLVVKRVRKNGKLIPVEVLVARFEVPRSKSEDFSVDLLLEISSSFDRAEPTLDGLGVRFIRADEEAVAYFSAQDDLVYAFSPRKGLVLPIAEALVDAEGS